MSNCKINITNPGAHTPIAQAGRRVHTVLAPGCRLPRTTSPQVCSGSCKESSYDIHVSARGGSPYMWVPRVGTCRALQ
eukprot:1117348-Prymnesium_polylepis.1